jgi:hypothetical protein
VLQTHAPLNHTNKHEKRIHRLADGRLSLTTPTKMRVKTTTIVPIVLALSAFCSLCFCQDQPNKQTSEKRPAIAKDRVPRRPFEIENLVNETRALPPEFALDALLRIAASKQVSDPQWKREILEEAFRLASELKNPLRQRAVYIPATSVDTRSGYRSNAFDLRLDALSVKSRVIAGMLAIDKDRALEMVGTISPKLPLKNLTCTDAMVYDVSELYQVLEKVSKVAFSEKQIEQGERLQLLLPFVENMTWPAQVAPIANLIVSLRLPNRELLPISYAFINALKKISADDRSFTDALLKDRMLRAVSDLFLFYRQQNLPYKELLDALRDYLTRHLQGTRCQDTFLSDGKEVPSYIRDTSNFLYPDRPLTIDDVRPSKLERGAPKTSYYRTLEAAKLMKDYKSLPWDDENNKPVTDETKATAEWQQRMLDYLTELEAWKGTSEDSEIDYFHQKSVLYFALAKLAPSGILREKVISSYLKTLSQSESQKESRIEWLLYAHQLLKSINAAQGEERARLSDLLIYAKDPALHLYGGLLKASLV